MTSGRFLLQLWPARVTGNKRGAARGAASGFRATRIVMDRFLLMLRLHCAIPVFVTARVT